MKKTDAKAETPPALREVIPETDSAFSVLSAILSVVPASRWTFARVKRSGGLESLYGSHVDAAARVRLLEELKRQRAKSPAGPRIAATLGPLDAFASGITLVFADARANFGILTMLRTAELGAFTSSEISMLTFALDAISDQLSALRMHASQRKFAAAPLRAKAPAPAPDDGAFYVLDSDLQIVLAWSSEDQRRIAMTGLHTRIAERLPTILEETVRELTQAWSGEAVRESGIAHPVPFLVVRTQPMSGPAGLFVGVRIDRYPTPDAMSGSAARYRITPREVQVLALLLDGNHLDQVAEQLQISSSTVQDHVKSMLDKTESRNRSELIARVLGWESAARTQQASSG